MKEEHTWGQSEIRCRIAVWRTCVLDTGFEPDEGPNQGHGGASAEQCGRSSACKAARSLHMNSLGPLSARAAKRGRHREWTRRPGRALWQDAIALGSKRGERRARKRTVPSLPSAPAACCGGSIAKGLAKSALAADPVPPWLPELGTPDMALHALGRPVWRVSPGRVCPLSSVFKVAARSSSTWPPFVRSGARQNSMIAVQKVCCAGSCEEE